MKEGNKHICDDLSFDECELTILRIAVDEAEQKTGLKVLS